MTGGGAECMRELRLWFPWLREDLTDVRLWLICFNYAGGGTWIFGRWQQAFPREIQVLPAMLPGRESRFSEKPYESLESLSSVLAKLVAELTRDSYRIMTIDDVEITKAAEEVTLELSQIERGGYEHFMMKEICEQPETITNAMRGRLL